MCMCPYNQCFPVRDGASLNAFSNVLEDKKKHKGTMLFDILEYKKLIKGKILTVSVDPPKHSISCSHVGVTFIAFSLWTNIYARSVFLLVGE